jgi:hypothetical protein
MSLGSFSYFSVLLSLDSFFVLYRMFTAAFHEESERIKQMVAIHVNLIAAVARFDENMDGEGLRGWSFCCNHVSDN